MTMSAQPCIDVRDLVVHSSNTIPLGHVTVWPNTADPYPWFQPVQPWYPSVTVTAIGVVHHCSFPLKAGALSPCGTELVSAQGTTGQQSSSDIDAVTCLCCLRALAKAR